MRFLVLSAKREIFSGFRTVSFGELFYSFLLIFSLLARHRRRNGILATSFSNRYYNFIPIFFFFTIPRVTAKLLLSFTIGCAPYFLLSA